MKLLLAALFLAITNAIHVPTPTPTSGVGRRVPVAIPPPSLVQRSGTGCNANNCARAVTGTRPGKTPSVESRQLDCSSFQKTVIYTYKHFPASIASKVTPTSVPAYASACTAGSPQSAYASACACWGIGPVQVTTTAAYDATCTRPAAADSCAGSLPDFGPVAADLRLVTCPLALPDVIPGCSCQRDTEGRAFCDAGFAGFSSGPCDSSADCDADERCYKNPCYGEVGSCEATAPGGQCDGGQQFFP